MSNLCVRIANDDYKRLSNQYQFTSTRKNVVTKILTFHVMRKPYILLKLEDLKTTELNSVVGNLVLILFDRKIL